MQQRVRFLYTTTAAPHLLQTHASINCHIITSFLVIIHFRSKSNPPIRGGLAQSQYDRHKSAYAKTRTSTDRIQLVWAGLKCRSNWLALHFVYTFKCAWIQTTFTSVEGMLNVIIWSYCFDLAANIGDFCTCHCGGRFWATLNFLFRVDGVACFKRESSDGIVGNYYRIGVQVKSIGSWSWLPWSLQLSLCQQDSRVSGCG